MIGRARVAAYEILRRVSTGRSDLPAALADVRDQLADERDRALVTDIVTGTVRWRAALDHLIGHAAKRPVARLDAEVVEILRLSLYQLLHLTRVPASAVVDDAVDLTKKAGKKSATLFRSRQRGAAESLSQPQRAAAAAEARDDRRPRRCAGLPEPHSVAPAVAG